MRPGKPLIFGRLGKTPLLGLPGNPVSSLVTALLFLRPAIAAMLGDGYGLAAAAGAAGGSPGRQRFAPGLSARQNPLAGRRCWIEANPVQDSSMLKVLAQSDALIIRAPHAPAQETGAPVEFIALE